MLIHLVNFDLDALLRAFFLNPDRLGYRYRGCVVLDQWFLTGQHKPPIDFRLLGFFEKAAKVLESKQVFIVERQAYKPYGLFIDFKQRFLLEKHMTQDLWQKLKQSASDSI